jgi:hypothetical protein
MKRLVLAAAVAMLAACGRPAEPPPPPSIPAPPLPPLPELKPSEDFSKDDFLPLPDAPAGFSWDLREGVSHSYGYEQESHLIVTASGAGQSGKVASRTQWKGDAKVVGGGGRGELVFVSAPIAQWNNNQPLSSEELNKVPKQVVQVMVREDGVFESRTVRSGQEDPKLDLFFALPSRELKPGEKETKEVHLSHVPEDAKYHGSQEIAHAGRRKVGRHECVKLLSKVDLEAVPPGDGQGRMFGWIASYFDPKERRFVRVEAALVLAVDVRREMRPADLKMPAYWLLNRVQADSKVTITLKD